LNRVLLCALGLLLLDRAAYAGSQKALFALIVGANQSVDTDLPMLRYADDDAARFLDLFRSLGAKAYLLTRPDDNTARLHPQALAEAHLPRQAELEQAVTHLVGELRQARERHVETVLYFVYAGHGNVRDGHGYITLEDARLNGAALQQLLDRLGADQSHLIVDACFSYYLAFDRGPGGARRLTRGFTRLEGLAQRASVGLLLSTSSARESHEWEGFQSGVFSYEVRAGMYGAADADGDGQVSYREIAAFVERANEAISNERFRPDVYARPPHDKPQLVDLRGALERRLEIDGGMHGHYLIEDSRGVRVAEFHNAAQQLVHLLHPSIGGVLYLRRLDGEEREWVLPATPDVVTLQNLPASAPRVAMRGAAHEAFNTIFSLPFDHGAVATMTLDREPAPSTAPRWRRPLGLTLLTAGALVAAAGGAALGTIPSLPAPGSSQQSAQTYNQSLVAHQAAGGALLGVGGVSAVVGCALLLLWHRDRLIPGVAATPSSVTLQIGGSF